MLPKYRRVTLDRLASLTSAIEEMEFCSERDEGAVVAKRELHTVKGEARLMGLTLISHLAHEVESMFISALESGSCPEHRDLLVDGLDCIGKLVEERDPYAPAPSARLDELLKELARITGSAGPPSTQAATTGPAASLAPAPKSTRSPEPISSRVPAADAAPKSTPIRPRRVALVEKLRASAEKRSITIMGHLRAFAADAPDKEADQALAREIHTLKGDTRIVGYDQASQVAAKIEEKIKDLVVSRKIEPLRGPIMAGLLLIEQLLNLDPPYPEAILAELSDYLRQPAAPASPPHRPADLAPISQQSAEPAEEVREEGEAFLAEEGGAVVTVGASHLTALTNVAGELLVRAEQVDRSIADMERLTSTMSRDLSRALTDRIEHSSARGISSRRDFVPRMSALSKELLSTVARAKEELFESRLYLGALQGEIREVRMIRVGELFDRHARALRELARDQNKRVRVKLAGSSVTVDKQVLDHLDEPLLHLMRNAVDHALESPEERKALGKDERASLELQARESGSFVEIFVRDDGRGIDPEKVKSAAIRKGIVSAETTEDLDDARVLSLLFEPGFSTRDTASEISGRGVGLDVVSTQLSELGGSASVSSREGKGTTFCLRCPISVAFARCLVVKVAEESYALPSSSVVEVLRLDPDSVEDTEAGRAIHYQEKRIPLVALSTALGVPSGATRGTEKIVVVRGDILAALQVDAIIGEREVVRKSLNPFLAGVSMITGTATVEERRLVMFIHMPELFRAIDSRQGRNSTSHQGMSDAPVRQRHVLVVDDSELTRDMLVPLLERLKYTVSEAVDGADALQAIARAKPDLLLTDLDMPIMDGFTLVQRVRSQPSTVDLPVVVFSTRGSDEDKKRAMEAGANSYLVKSAFRAEELDRVIRRHLGDTEGR